MARRAYLFFFVASLPLSRSQMNDSASVSPAIWRPDTAVPDVGRGLEGFVGLSKAKLSLRVFQNRVDSVPYRAYHITGFHPYPLSISPL